MTRLTEYRPETQLPRIVELMSEGASIVEVMADLRLCRKTWYNWIDDASKPEFKEAAELGNLLSEAWWQRNGRTNLGNPQFSYTGWYMNMKNRFGWADKQETHNTGSMTVNWPLGKSKLDE